MNTYKYEFSYKPLDEIKDHKEKVEAWSDRNSEEDFQKIKSEITHFYNFMLPETCEVSSENHKIIIIKSKQPASVFDDIVSAFCNAKKGKYIARRID